MNWKERNVATNHLSLSSRMVGSDWITEGSSSRTRPRGRSDEVVPPSTCASEKPVENQKGEMRKSQRQSAKFSLQFKTKRGRTFLAESKVACSCELNSYLKKPNWTDQRVLNNLQRPRSAVVVPPSTCVEITGWKWGHTTQKGEMKIVSGLTICKIFARFLQMGKTFLMNLWLLALCKVLYNEIFIDQSFYWFRYLKSISR